MIMKTLTEKDVFAIIAGSVGLIFLWTYS